MPSNFKKAGIAGASQHDWKAWNSNKKHVKNSNAGWTTTYGANSSSTKLSSQKHQFRMSQQPVRDDKRVVTKQSVLCDNNGGSIKLLSKKKRLISAANNYGANRFKNISYLKPIEKKGKLGAPPTVTEGFGFRVSET